MCFIYCVHFGGFYSKSVGWEKVLDFLHWFALRFAVGLLCDTQS